MKYKVTLDIYFHRITETVEVEAGSESDAYEEARARLIGEPLNQKADWDYDDLTSVVPIK